MFITDGGGLGLARVNGSHSDLNGDGVPEGNWNHLASSAISGYTHGKEVTLKIEFTDDNTIKGYIDGELLITYTDTRTPLTGTLAGIRAETAGTVFTNFTYTAADSNDYSRNQ